MALLDFGAAPWRGKVQLLPDNASAPRTKPRLIILHSIVGDAQGAYNYFKYGTSLESTFIVAGRWGQTDWPDGFIVQAMDTEREADANYRANPFAISVETEDDGSPDDTPWTSRQLDALAWLIATCARIHDIPIRKADAWDGTGVGWHVQFGAPGPWTPVQKSCPGRARIAQIPLLLEQARAVAAGGLEDMPLSDDEKTWIRSAIREEVNRGISLVLRGDATHPNHLEGIDDKVDRLLLAQSTDGGTGTGGEPPLVVQLSDEQLASLREGLAQPFAAHIAAMLANADRAAATSLEQAASSGGAA